MKDELTWRVLKAMNTLYQGGKIPVGQKPHSHLKHLKSRGLIGNPLGNSTQYIALDRYKAYYEKNFAADFERYEAFLLTIDPKADGRKTCTIRDLITLIYIHDQRDELKKTLTTRHTFSSNIFDYGGSKYLENRPRLEKLVYKILGIEHFPSEDPKVLQWRLVVDCLNPQIVVLCENLDYLKTPSIARQHNIELWHVGGNNTANIHHISDEKLNKPLYYTCDWDYDGLRIYCNIKNILREKNKEIQLCYPSNPQSRMPVKSPHHKSEWRHKLDFSGLKEECFTQREIELISELIRRDEWIEEEKNDLLGMVGISAPG